MNFQRTLPLAAAAAAVAGIAALAPAHAAFAAPAVGLPIQADTPPSGPGPAAPDPGAAPNPGAASGTGSSAPAGGQSIFEQERSLVQIGIKWSGYLRYHTADGYVWTKEPVEVSARCSGFFVSSTGHVVTAGHCIDPARGRYNIIRSFLLDQVSDGVLTQQEATNLLPNADANWTVEGSSRGSAAGRTVYLSQPEDVQGRVVTDPRVAQVVDFKAFDQGDVALLKIEASGTPALPIGNADPANGADVTLAGFPGAVSNASDPARIRASFKTGTVSSHQVSDTGIPQIEVNADISAGMSGGPALDVLGNVLGVNSSSADTTQAFNFITDTTDLKDWLSSKNVQLAPAKVEKPRDNAGTARRGPGPAAPASSSGMPELWVIAGAALLLGLATTVGTLLIVLLKRRSPRTNPIPARSDTLS